MYLPFGEAQKLIKRANENRVDEVLYERYLVELPWTDKPVSAEEYLEKHRPDSMKHVDRRSKDEIMREILGGE